jgi:hypothetical protein
MTLDKAVMDLKRSFAPGMGYVALSRVMNMDGLFLEGLGRQAFMVSPEALEIDSTLRAASKQAESLIASGQMHRESRSGLLDIFSQIGMDKELKQEEEQDATNKKVAASLPALPQLPDSASSSRRAADKSDIFDDFSTPLF